MAFGLPKPAELMAQLDRRFGQLREDLAGLQRALDEILAELRTQRGG